MINDADARRLWGKRTHQLLPYVPGEQPRDRTFIKLNTNENPYPPAPEVQNVIRAYPADRFRLYPDPGSRQLRSVLAGYLGVTENQIFVGNGSDEVLAIAFQAFFNSRAAIAAAGFGSAGIADGAVVESECIVFPDVTYSFYPVYARMYDIPFRTIPLDEGFNVPLDACTAPSAGLVLANPNAPTGIALSLEAIGKLADSDRNRLVMVDEAYVDFGAESAIELLFRAAPLHDVGKVGIPDGILLKPGKLEPAEFEIMKNHASIGAEAIGKAMHHIGSASPFLQPAQEIALSHHEK